MSYGWIVDRDYTDQEFTGEVHKVSVFGHSRISEKLKQKLLAGEGEEFKMYDADDNLYYSGRIVGDYDGFEPLDDYGTPNAGAIDIHYKDKTGNWSPL